MIGPGSDAGCPTPIIVESSLFAAVTVWDRRQLRIAGNRYIVTA
jgi:hypothetical protein